MPGRVGKVKGNGVYTYNGDARDPWDGLAACLGTKPSSLDEDTVRERLLYVQSLEAIRTPGGGRGDAPDRRRSRVCAGLGISGPSRRRVLVMSTGLARPNSRAARRTMRKRFGGRFEPPAMLLDMAKDNRRFHEL